ncbi:MAG: pilus assembly protein PilM [Sedimentisphaerales bacterium]|nr:pilus assembly protein PilM [Sedimentisphaerales bacterium]
MFGLLKCQVYPIGIDVTDDRVKLAQLASNGKGLELIAATSSKRPDQASPGSSKWQRWVLQALTENLSNADFKSKDVVASVPARELFIDHLKIPKGPKSKLEENLLQKVKQRLPFEHEQAMLKHIITEDNNVMVMVMDREKINRHLAVYEQSKMHIQSINVWPVALASMYVNFFGRRRTDRDSVVMILDFEVNSCNILICRHRNPLYAKSVSIGVEDFRDGESLNHFVLELNACRRHFGSLYKKTDIERAIFLTGDKSSVDAQSIFADIAKQLDMPAQIGNCLAAVNISSKAGFIEKRDCDFSWAAAFGLSLS